MTRDKLLAEITKVATETLLEIEGVTDVIVDTDDFDCGEPFIHVHIETEEDDD